MPITVLLDNSFSMNCNFSLPTGELITTFQMAKHGVKFMFDFLKKKFPFEMTKLATFGENPMVLTDFTRDYDYLKICVDGAVTSSKANLVSTLSEITQQISKDDQSTHQIIIITDGSNTPNMENVLEPPSNKPVVKNLNFPPTIEIHICLINLNKKFSLDFYKEILKKACKSTSVDCNVRYFNGQLLIPENPLISFKETQIFFKKLCENTFSGYFGVLKCGHIEGKITMFPMFNLDELPDNVQKDLNIINIYGFMPIEEMMGVPALSRHYIIPVAENDIKIFKTWSQFITTVKEMDDEAVLAAFKEEKKQPHYAVLLYHTLKTNKMVAICAIGTSKKWYGMLNSVTANNNKENLVLYTFKPGLNTIPWITNFHHLTSIQTLPENGESAKNKTSKKTYSSWFSRQDNISNDIQKLLKLCKKLPDKFDQLLLEVTKIKRAAWAINLTSLLDVLIKIFEDPENIPNIGDEKTQNQIEQILNILKNR